MKRKAIRKDEYLAAALSLLLPYEERTALRRARVPAETIIAMFSPDHIQLHALNHEEPWVDEWHNLHPTLRGPHKEKSKRDTTIVAKVKRIVAKRARGKRGMVAGAFWGDMAANLRHKRKISQRPSPWPPRGSRKLRSRPWPSPSP